MTPFNHSVFSWIRIRHLPASSIVTLTGQTHQCGFTRSSLGTMNEKAGCAREAGRDDGTVEQKSGEFASWQELLFSGLCPSYLACPSGFNGGHVTD